MKSCSSSRGEEPAVRFGFLVFIQGWALTGSPGCRDKQPVVLTPGRGQEPENGRAEPSLSTRAVLCQLKPIVKAHAKLKLNLYLTVSQEKKLELPFL